MDLLIRNVIKVGAFLEEPADDAVGIFDGTFFPGMVGFTEEGLGAELLVEEMVFMILRAVIVGDGKAEGRGER